MGIKFDSEQNSTGMMTIGRDICCKLALNNLYCYFRYSRYM